MTVGRFDDLDLSQDLSKKQAEERLEAAQEHMLRLRLQLAGLDGDERLGPRCASCSRAGTRAARGARSGASSPR